MLYQSDDLVLAHAAHHRQALLAEAHAHRQARLAQAAQRQPAPLTRPAGRLLGAAGALLVRWGARLQQHSELEPTTFVDTRPA